MTRILSIFLVLLAIGSILAAEPAANDEKQVAIIHYDNLKLRELDGTATNLTYSPMIVSPKVTPCLLLRNELMTPREITVRILGLKQNDYDIYINNEKVGSKTRAELEAGIPISFDGTLIPDDLRSYYNKLQASCSARAKRYTSSDSRDIGVAGSVLKACASWVDSIFRGDKMIRSVPIVITVKGQPLALSGGDRFPVDKPKDFAKSAKHLGEAIQIIRRDVMKTIDNQMYRNDVLDAMTPLDCKLTSSSDFKPGATVTVRAQLTNWTDRKINGKVSLCVPSGLTVKELSAEVSLQGYAKTFDAKFEVTVPGDFSTSAAISATADLDVEGVPLQIVRQLEVAKPVP